MLNSIHAVYATHQLGELVYVTTAPDAYDSFGTRTLVADAGRDTRDKVLRIVAIQPEHLDWQRSRYASGLHSSVTLDEATRFPTIYRLA